MWNPFAKTAAASDEPIGEELLAFFERHNYVIPNYDDDDYEDIDEILFKDSTGLHKKAIVHPIVSLAGARAGAGGRREIVLNADLHRCMAKYQKKVETPTGNLIRQGPIAFLIATQKGHSTLIVTCENMVFGIGAIMSEPTECLEVDPTFMETIAARFDPSVKPNTEEFALDIVSPDDIYQLFTTKRSSKGISYAAGKVVALLPFKQKNADNLLRFLNQTDHPAEMPWGTKEKTDRHTGIVNSIEINTNVKYMTTSSPFNGSANIMNCANFLELIFAGIVSGSAYAGLISIPDKMRIISGSKYSVFGLDSESQPETIFSPVSSRSVSAASTQEFSQDSSAADMHRFVEDEENSGDSGDNYIYGGPGLEPLVLKQPHMQDILRIGSPPGSPKDKVAKTAKVVKFKIKKTKKNQKNAFGNGINIKTLHQPRRKKITRREKEREKRRATRRRKTRRSTN